MKPKAENIALVSNTQPQGESIATIIRYWIPELCSSSLLIFLPFLLDAYFIAKLKSLHTYSALGLSGNVLHLMIKLSEAVMVSSIAVIGRYNGANNYEECGRSLGDAFWSTIALGLMQLALVFSCAPYFFTWIGTDTQLATVGVPFLQTQSIAVFFAFTFQAFLGFFRGIKNTRIPFYINVLGIGLYILADYLLIFGTRFTPALHLQGSAIASLIRYVTVSVCAAVYLFYSNRYKVYGAQQFLFTFRPEKMCKLVLLSLPIMIDKSALSLSYIWLSKMIAPLGTHALASLDIIKNLERFSFIPAIAFAQIVTFLVSNSIGASNYKGARENIKKVLLLSMAFVGGLLTMICLNAEYCIRLFDQKGLLTQFTSGLLPILAPLVFFDLLQVILAGALRGAGDVKTVMFTRTLCCGLFFVPLSYMIRLAPIQNQALKFGLIYSIFYVNTLVMGLIFAYRISGTQWLSKKI